MISRSRVRFDASRPAVSAVGFVVAMLVATTDPAGAQQPGEATGPELVGALREPAFLLSVGRIVDDREWRILSGVLGTTREQDLAEQSLTTADELIVPRVLAGRGLRLGDRVQFLRLAGAVRDPINGENLGKLARPTGVAIVDSLAGDVAVVVVTHGFEPILIGDRVRAVAEGDTTWPASAGEPVIEIEGHVVAFQEEKPTHLPFDIVFLRLPWAYALAPGSWVELYRPGSVADGYTLPDTRIGSAVIVRADDEIAAALLVNVRRSDLDEGDRFRGIETALQ